MRFLGGKYRIAPWIISHLPEHTKYCEPFGGAASVLMCKKPCQHEIYNDQNKYVWSVFRCLQSHILYRELKYRLKHTPYSRTELDLAFAEKDSPDIVEVARRTLVRAQMAFIPNGSTSTDFWMSFDNSPTQNGATRFVNWKSAIRDFHKRLENVVLENTDAMKLIRMVDIPEMLFYVDPPYLPGLWDSRNESAYSDTLSLEQHKELLSLLTSCKGMVVLSGYSNSLYHEALAGWTVKMRKSTNNQAHRRIECIWINPAAQGHLKMQANILKIATTT